MPPRAGVQPRAARPRVGVPGVDLECEVEVCHRRLGLAAPRRLRGTSPECRAYSKALAYARNRLRKLHPKARAACEALAVCCARGALACAASSAEHLG